MLDTRRAFFAFGFQARTDFRAGLQKTVVLYIRQRNRELEEKVNLPYPQEDLVEHEINFLSIF